MLFYSNFQVDIAFECQQRPGEKQQRLGRLTWWAGNEEGANFNTWRRKKKNGERNESPCRHTIEFQASFRSAFSAHLSRFIMSRSAEANEEDEQNSLHHVFQTKLC